VTDPVYRDFVMLDYQAEKQAKEQAQRRTGQERWAKELERQAKELALQQAKQERQAKELALQQSEQERQAKELALQEITRLKAKLRELGLDFPA